MRSRTSCQPEDLVVALNQVPAALTVHPATDEVFVGTASGTLALLDTQSNDTFGT